MLYNLIFLTTAHILIQIVIYSSHCVLSQLIFTKEDDNGFTWSEFDIRDVYAASAVLVVVEAFEPSVNVGIAEMLFITDGELV